MLSVQALDFEIKPASNYENVKSFRFAIYKRAGISIFTIQVNTPGIFMKSGQKYLFSLPPEHLLPFFEDYLEDEDEIDPKAGGGDPMTIGQMVNHII